MNNAGDAGDQGVGADPGGQVCFYASRPRTLGMMCILLALFIPVTMLMALVLSNAFSDLSRLLLGSALRSLSFKAVCWFLGGLFTLAWAFDTILLLTSSRPSLTLSEGGLTLRRSVGQVSLAWAEIGEVSVSRLLTGRALAVWPRDPETSYGRILPVPPFVRPFLWRFRAFLYGSERGRGVLGRLAPISIPEAHVSVPADELLAPITSYRTGLSGEGP